MSTSSDIRLETEAERKERIETSLQALEEICQECSCTPLDVAESLGFELAGARIVN